MTEQIHISYPSINQFNHLIKNVNSQCKYHNVIKAPIITFQGTVKLHGTNFGMIRPKVGTFEDIYFQSRERIITPVSDNAGAAIFAYGKSQAFNEWFDLIVNTYSVDDNTNVQIYGEWAGGNIQKGVGLNFIEKSLFVFGIRIITNGKEVWLSSDEIVNIVHSNSIKNVYTVYDFPYWELEIDMENPKNVQNTLIEITNKVEAECPVSRALLPDTKEPLVGEGVVWTAIKSDIELPFSINGLNFKVKGEKHQSSRVTTLAAVDIGKVNSIKEFVEKTVTINRLEQGISKLEEMGLPLDLSSIGPYIKWVNCDIAKEEMDVLVESNLTFKEVASGIANKARVFFLEKLNG